MKRFLPICIATIVVMKQLKSELTEQQMYNTICNDFKNDSTRLLCRMDLISTAILLEPGGPHTSANYLISFLMFYNHFLREAYKNKSDLTNLVSTLRGSCGPKFLRIKVTPLIFQTRFKLNSSVIEYVNSIYNEVTDTWLALNRSLP